MFLQRHVDSECEQAFPLKKKKTKKKTKKKKTTLYPHNAVIYIYESVMNNT